MGIRVWSVRCGERNARAVPRGYSGPSESVCGAHTLTHNSQLLALGSSVFLGRYRRHLEDFPE